MKKCIFIAPFFAIFCSFCISASATEPSICYRAKFSEAEHIFDLPPRLDKFLDAVADRDEPFQAGDVRWNDKLKTQRFAFAAVNSDCILVAIENGGRGYSVELRYFIRSDSDWDQEQGQFLGSNLPNSYDEFLGKAYFSFGNMYAQGNGVAQNYLKALKWYRQAAEKKLPEAQFALGEMYANGEGVAKDEKVALKWLQLAAAHGPAYFNYDIGRLFEEGKGLSRNVQMAVKWYRSAARRGDGNAQQTLGMAYEKGALGFARNFHEAIKLYRLAAVHEDPNFGIATLQLGKMYADGRGVHKNRVIAMALLNITNGYDRSDLAENIRQKMSAGEIDAAQELCYEMEKDRITNGWVMKNLLPALDRYAANPTVKEEVGDCCHKPRINKPPYGCISIHN